VDSISANTFEPDTRESSPRLDSRDVDDKAESLLASELAKADETSGQKPYEWILHPALDLLFCCGGILWILFPLHYFILKNQSGSPLAQLMICTAALGTIIFSQSHTIATLVRVYDNKETRERFSLYTYWLALACAGLALMGCLNKEIAGIFCKVYLLIVSQHFTAQTYGLALLYCYKRDYRLNNWDKGILAALMRSTLWFAVLRQCTYKDWSGDKFLGQELPFWGPLPEWMVHTAAICILLSSLALVFRIARRFLLEKQIFPLPAALLVVTGALIFVLGSKMTGTLWIYVPAFFHGSQYLVASTAFYLKEKGLPEGLSTHQIANALSSETCIRYVGFLVLAGIALFLGIPEMLKQFGFDHSLAIASIFTTAQFHHVLTDHAIWRMREQRVRELLVA